LRNLIIVTVLAQSLHLIFHRTALQGTDHKYDPRPFPRSGRMFTFGDQYWDNVFWTLASGVTIWSAYEALVWWSMANGYASVWLWSDGWVWFLAIFFLIPVWESFYFYWIHRLLHSDLLYRFHALHHRNTDVGPWSGLSMHPIEHVIYFSSVLIFFIVPAHPIHMINLASRLGVAPAQGHTGFDRLVVGEDASMDASYYAHYLHHKYFEVNYADGMVPLDKWFGSFHDGTPEAHEAMKARRRRRGV